MITIRASLAAALVTAFASGGAFADPVVYQTAGLVDYSASGEPGDYFIDDTRYIGAVFTLAQATDVSAIGGYFTQYSSGDIFGAIASITPSAASPYGYDYSIVGHAVFTPDGLDDTVALSAHLAAGTYAVAFGSGMFGTTGTSGLVDGQDGSGATMFSGAGDSYALFDGTDTRIVVYGTASAVPEPASVALLAAGLGVVGAGLRRARKATQA